MSIRAFDRYQNITPVIECITCVYPERSDTLKKLKCKPIGFSPFDSFDCLSKRVDTFVWGIFLIIILSIWLGFSGLQLF